MHSKEQKTKLGLTLATRITICRILGIPVFVLLLIYYKTYLTTETAAEPYRLGALAVFILIAATDALDGYLARTRNEVTRLGSILDPIADKGLMLAALIGLTRPSLEALTPQFPVWFTLLVISRDSILIVGAFLVNAIHSHVDIKPRIMGKLSTFLMMTSIVMVLTRFSQASVNIVLWVTGFCVLVSGIQYLIDGAVQLEHGHGQREQQ